MGHRDELTRRTMDNFRRIVQALRSSHKVAAHLNLTGAQLFVIAALNESETPLSVGDIARETQTDPSTASVVVGRLVDAGYVKRSRSEQDSRRVELSLTSRGRALQKAHPQSAPQRRLTRALSRLPEADAEAFDAILSSVVGDMGLGEEPAPMMFDEPDGPRPKKRERATPAARIPRKRTSGN